MDELSKFKKDLDSRKKQIDFELNKLERELNTKPETIPVQQTAPKPAPQQVAVSRPEPVYKKHSDFHFSKKIAAGTSFVLLVVILVGVFAFLSTRNLTKEEFVSRVQGCKSGSYLGQVDNSLVKYSTNNCQVTKQITYIGDKEPQQIRTLFEGKAMTCKYTKGQFNFDNVEYMMKDIDSCWGDLKEILVELNGYKLGLPRGV
jgi:hypothetical protein